MYLFADDQLVTTNFSTKETYLSIYDLIDATGYDIDVTANYTLEWTGVEEGKIMSVHKYQVSFFLSSVFWQSSSQPTLPYFSSQPEFHYKRGSPVLSLPTGLLKQTLARKNTFMGDYVQNIGLDKCLKFCKVAAKIPLHKLHLAEFYFYILWI